jgi:hypothetical protein
MAKYAGIMRETYYNHGGLAKNQQNRMYATCCMSTLAAVEVVLGRD